MLYMQYNFYDYDTDHPELSAFDVHQCYTPEQTDELVIVFPGKILHTGACGLCGLVGKVNWLKKIVLYLLLLSVLQSSVKPAFSFLII